MTTGMTRTEAVQALAKLKRSIGNPTEFAQLVDLPIELALGGANVSKKDTTLIRTQVDFVQHYKSIMLPCIRENIERSSIGNVVAHAQGVRIGRGQVWLRAIPRPGKSAAILVVAINTERIPGCDPTLPECC